MREKRTFTIPSPNKVHHRVTQIAGDTRHELSWDGPQGLLASLTVTPGRVQIALVLDGSLIIDAEGATLRDAYRRAWHEARVERARRNIEEEMEHWARRQRMAETAVKRLEAENAALKQQVTTQAQELQALRDQLAACQRAPEEVTARLQKAEAHLRDMQIRLSGALAHQATTQGRADELAKQLGVPASIDLAVRGPNTKVYPLASQATSDAAAAGEAVRS